MLQHRATAVACTPVLPTSRSPCSQVGTPFYFSPELVEVRCCCRGPSQLGQAAPPPYSCACLPALSPNVGRFSLSNTPTPHSQDKQYDRKSDVWSAGCVLYELCALQRPFRGSSVSAIAVKVLGPVLLEIGGAAQHSAVVEEGTPPCSVAPSLIQPTNPRSETPLNLHHRSCGVPPHRCQSSTHQSCGSW